MKRRGFFSPRERASSDDYDIEEDFSSVPLSYLLFSLPNHSPASVTAENHRAEAGGGGEREQRGKKREKNPLVSLSVSREGTNALLMRDDSLPSLTLLLSKLGVSSSPSSSIEGRSSTLSGAAASARRRGS